MRRTLLLLLLCLTCGAWLRAQQVLRVPRKEQDPWKKTLIEGGMRRWDNTFVSIDNAAVGSLLSMNFVDGYKWGIQNVAVGRIFHDCSRVELRPRVVWGQDRHTWMGGMAARYHITPSRYGYIGFDGGKWTEDFDPDPVLSEQANSLFSGLFGWNHVKLYERTYAETSGSIALSGVTQLTARVSWEQRELVENHRKRGLTRAEGEANIPVNYLVDRSAFDPLTAQQPSWHLWMMSIQLDYIPGRKLHVLNDMDVEARSSLPTFSLRIDGGWNTPDGNEVNRCFVSVDLSAAYTLRDEKLTREWKFFAAAGGFLVHKTVDLMDFRHFDAQAFSWGQIKGRPQYAFSSRDLGDLSQFALLRNYELSTDRCWTEAHSEWNMDGRALRQLTGKYGIHDFVQVHAVKVDGAPLHTELCYGIDMIQKLRLGVAFGIDDGKWDGAAFTFNAKL